MKTLLIGLTCVIMFAGCARAKITAWTEDTFTVCCQNNRCGQQKLNEVAANRCPSARAKSGFETDGATTISDAGFMGKVATTSKHPCVVYQCH